MTDITPVIFTSDEAVLREQVGQLAPRAPWIQLDLSDGTMVPTESVMDMEKLKVMIAAHPHTSFEAHLMVDNPVKYLKSLADAGFMRVIAQVECSDPRYFLDEAATESVEVGLALDGASEVEAIEPFLDAIDLAVIMTIEAGAADGPFLPESLEKVKAIRHHVPDLSIAAEGNIDVRNAKLLTEAGVTRLVVSPARLMSTSSRNPVSIPPDTAQK